MHLWNQLYVTHMWTGGGGLLAKLGLEGHHSLVTVSRQGYSGAIVPVFYIDLIISANQNRAKIRVVKAADRSLSGYRVSTSYSPNPVVKSGTEVLAAFDYAIDKTAERYNVLTNNCQKFARIFMTQLGAKHKRKLFHL